MMNTGLGYCMIVLMALLPASAAARWSADAEKCANADPDDEQLAACTRAIQSGKLSSSELAITLYNRGMSWGKRGDPDRAMADLDEAIRQDRRLAPAYAMRARGWEQKGDYQRAFDDCKEARRLNPKDGPNEVFCMFMKDIARSTEAIRRNPKDPKTYLARANDAWVLLRHEYDRMIADYDQAIALDPGNADAYSGRAQAWSSKGDHDRAIADYSEAIRLSPKDPGAYHARASAWQRKLDYDKAIADYSMAIRLDPNTALRYYDRGIARSIKGDYDQSIADFGEVLRLNPLDVAAFNARGISWAAKGDYDRAISDFDEVVKMDPKVGLKEAYRNRGFVYFARGEFIACERNFAEAVKLDVADPYSAIAHYLGQSRAGHPAEAETALMARTAEIDKSKWPQPIIDLLTRRSASTAVIEAASAGDSELQRKQRCEAAFYVGEWHLLQGRNAEGRTWVEQAQRECPGDLPERFAASAELKSLTPQRD
jgi:tetratricopeptide (TPR) repeat protein